MQLMLLVVFAMGELAAQSPSGTFDLHLENGASVSQFVARGSHLYFVCRTAGGYAVVVTDRNGGAQSSVSLGTNAVVGFDIDEQGNAYVLSNGTQVTVFNEKWGVDRVFPVDPPVVAMTVVGGRLMGAHEDGKLNYLESSEPVRTLEAYPAPWTLFAAGDNRIGVLRPKSPKLLIFELDLEGSAYISAGGASSPVDAAAASDGRLYLLGKQVTEFDAAGSPSRSLDLGSADGFHAQMIRILGDTIYLADHGGRVASYSLPATLEKAMPVDGGPRLMTNLEEVRAAAMKAGFSGNLEIRMTVGVDGGTSDVRIEPAQMAGYVDLTSAVGRIKFKPKIVAGKAVVTDARLSIGVP